MAIKLTWLPNTEADIDEYQIWRAPDNVNFTQQTTIDHNTGNALIFDTSTGRFFWEDPTGTTTHWYKIRAVDTTANLSAFTVSKQAGPPLPPICVLFGTVLQMDGEPETEAQVQIFIQDTKKTKEGQFVSTDGVTSAPVEVFTDDNGFWEADIIRQAVVRVVIPKINLDIEVTVPDAASAEITTLL
jgi:hypothetical protein